MIALRNAINAHAFNISAADPLNFDDYNNANLRMYSVNKHYVDRRASAYFHRAGGTLNPHTGGSNIIQGPLVFNSFPIQGLLFGDGATVVVPDGTTGEAVNVPQLNAETAARIADVNVEEAARIAADGNLLHRAGGTVHPYTADSNRMDGALYMDGDGSNGGGVRRQIKEMADPTLDYDAVNVNFLKNRLLAAGLIAPQVISGGFGTYEDVFTLNVLLAGLWQIEVTLKLSISSGGDVLIPDVQINYTGTGVGHMLAACYPHLGAAGTRITGVSLNNPTVWPAGNGREMNPPNTDTFALISVSGIIDLDTPGVLTVRSSGTGTAPNGTPARVLTLEPGCWVRVQKVSFP